MDDNVAFLYAVKGMDEEALAKAFDLYSPAIYQYAYRHCRDARTADQIVGDVFAKLMDQLSKGSGPVSNIRSYLFEIAYHLMIDEARHNHRLASIDKIELFLPAANYTERSAEEHMLVGIILQAIRCDLTDSQKHVIVLRFFEGFSVKETALIMGKTANNIKVIQNRAVVALRKAIADRAVQSRSVEQDTVGQ